MATRKGKTRPAPPFRTWIVALPGPLGGPAELTERVTAQDCDTYGGTLDFSIVTDAVPVGRGGAATYEHHLITRSFSPGAWLHLKLDADSPDTIP